jgi:hypothetical protein
MALTLEGALGREIRNVEDAVLARAMFHYVKHGVPDKFSSAMEAAEADIDAMSNTELLGALQLGFDDMAYARRITDGAR